MKIQHLGLLAAFLLSVFSTRPAGADPDLVEALRKNPDPAHLTGYSEWQKLSPSSKEEALRLISAGLAAHPDWVTGRCDYASCGWPRLQLAAFRGQVDIVRLLLDRGAPMVALVPFPQEQPVSALQAALGMASPPLYERPQPTREMLELVLSRGAEVNQRMALGGRTPLEGAAALDVGLVGLLLDHGADVNSVDEDGRTPIFYTRSVAVAELLLAKGARVDGHDKKGSSPLNFSTLQGTCDLKLGNWFLAHGVRPDIWSMAALGETERVRQLLSKEPGLARQMDSHQATALEWALVTDHPDTVRCLVPLSDIKRVNSQRLLHGSIYHLDALGMLLSAGANPNQRDTQGETALHLAAREGQVGAMRLLLKYKANPNLVSDRGETPLHLAAQGVRVEAVELLLARGVGVNVRRKDGDTPLLAALGDIHRSGVTSIVKALLKAGAEVNGKARSLAAGDPALAGLLARRGSK